MFVETDDRSNVLIVDPDSSTRSQFDNVLNGSHTASEQENIENVDYRVSGCDNWDDAVTLFNKTESEKLTYQVMVVETELADERSGLALINEIWKTEPDLQVIIFTSNNQLNWHTIMDTVGQSDQLLVIQKPATDLELNQAVHAMIRKWQLSKQSQNVMNFLEHKIEERTQEIEAANQQLLQSEKLASVGQLAAGVSHEINTPVQYVNDNIQAIKDYVDDLSELIESYKSVVSNMGDETITKFEEIDDKCDLEFIMEDMPQAIDQSLDGIKQISRIVQAMKGFSHMGQTQANTVDINSSLENTLVVAKNNYKYIADVTTDFASGAQIECYPAELNQVFLNLITNAAHAIEATGTERGTIGIKTEENEDHVIIYISDTGTGIAEEHKEKVFDSFFTTKGVGIGTGQGLNIAFRIINQEHGGSITFDTEMGKGTTFIIKLFKKLPQKAGGE